MGGGGASNVPENLEWSLPVPSVRELAMQLPERVPPRYLRTHDHLSCQQKNRGGEDASVHRFLGVPLIDMSKLLNPTTQPAELHKLHSASLHWGLFQLVNHGISNSLVLDMKVQVQEFFNLPQQEKKRWAQKPGSLEGYGQAFVISEEQKLEWCDMIFLKSLPTHKRNMSFWPELPSKFRETLGRYSEEAKQVALSLLKFMAMSLGLEGHEFAEVFKDGKYDVRMNCYPPCPEPEQVLGIAPHADISGITLLLDCGDLPGLQVLKDGQWVPVQPMPNAIVVNTGNVIEIMSNGEFVAPQHLAVVDRLKERFSVVTFCYPNEGATIGPSRKLVTSSGRPPLYMTLTTEEYFRQFYNQKLDGTPFLDTLKI